MQTCHAVNLTNVLSYSESECLRLQYLTVYMFTDMILHGG